MVTDPGSVYTPPEIAELMTSWAIRSDKDKILDLGIGTGIFVFSCYERLLTLGAEPDQAQKHLYGAEIQESAFDLFADRAKNLGLTFPHLTRNDFFQIEYPEVDVIIGNPPYVRRSQIPKEQYKQIRKSVLDANGSLSDSQLSHLSDLYAYFMLRAIPLLKQGGRLAIIAADSWLNVRYGRLIKKQLRTSFEIERIISFDYAVFPDAQVRPAILFATKKSEPAKNSNVAFSRVLDGLTVADPSKLFEDSESDNVNVITHKIATKNLDENNPWGIYFKISGITGQIDNRHLLTPLATLANTRIGLQTLAKDFFALSQKKVNDSGIEPEYLEPFAYSLSKFDSSVIDCNSEAPLQLFFCSETKRELAGTRALDYILLGESQKVRLRGTDITVTGFHNKERIKNANRKNWYDVKSEINKRGRAHILIPRLIFESFNVIWNQEQFVPGGTVIEFLPINKQIDVRVYLAVLNSTFMEMIIRGYSQIYGGGTYTVSLSQIKKIPIINIHQLTVETHNSLICAFESFLSSGTRTEIDHAVWSILGVKGDLFDDVVSDLRSLCTSAKRNPGI